VNSICHQKICAIIPAYNEESNIARTIRDLQEHRPDILPLVIDDGSRDDTVKQATRPGVVLLKLPVNLGVGGTVQTGLIYAKKHDFDNALQFDGDGQHKASEIAKILDPIIRGEADAVIGSRFLDRSEYSGGLGRRFGIFILRSVITLVTGRRFTDTSSGFRCYGRKAIEYLTDNYPQDYPEPESIVDLHRSGFRIIEVSVDMRDREGGVSSIGAGDSVYYMMKVTLATLVAATRRARS
jgi:hypothetical protein